MPLHEDHVLVGYCRHGGGWRAGVPPGRDTHLQCLSPDTFAFPG